MQGGSERYPTYERVASAFRAVVRTGGQNYDLFICDHMHRTRRGAVSCGRWWISREARGLCSAECHRNVRRASDPGCCSCHS